MDMIFVRVVDNFPPGVNACVTLDEEGDYNVYLNGALSAKGQRDAFRHELAHVGGGHLRGGCLACECERQAKEVLSGSKNGRITSCAPLWNEKNIF